MAFRDRLERVVLVLFWITLPIFIAWQFPRTMAVITGLCGLLVAYVRFVVRPRIMRARENYRLVFEEAYKGGPFIPKIRFGHAYGYPRFFLLFNSPEEKVAAQEHVERFEQALAVTCRHFKKVRNRPFNPKEAVFYRMNGSWGWVNKYWAED